MIKKYDRKTHSEFIKKFRKLFNPQKWDKIVKDNAETYIKHGKFQKEKRNAVRLMKKNKVQPGKQGIACAPPTSVPWKIKEACEQEIKDVKERVKNGQKQENAQDD